MLSSIYFFIPHSLHATEYTVANLLLPIFPFVLTYGHVCDEWYPLAWGDGENDIGDVVENINRKAGEMRMLIEFLPGQSVEPYSKEKDKKRKFDPANSLCVSLVRSQGFVEAFEMKRKKEEDGRMVARSYALIFRLEDRKGRILSEARSLSAENLVYSGNDASLDPEWDEDIILKLPKDKSQKMTLKAILVDENAVLSDGMSIIHHKSTHYRSLIEPHKIQHVLSVAKNLGEVSIEIPKNLQPVSDALDVGQLIPTTWYPVKAFGNSKLSDPQIKIGLSHGLGKGGKDQGTEEMPPNGGRMNIYSVKGSCVEEVQWRSIELQIVISDGANHA